MIVMDKREECIGNIQAAVRAGNFNCKVEPDDPQLTPEQRQQVREEFLAMHPVQGAPTARYRAGNAIAHAILRVGTPLIGCDSDIVGAKHAAGLERAIVTSNHFSPIDNTLIRQVVWGTGRSRMPVVAYEENLAMSGLFGFLMHYTDTIPLSMSPSYARHCFEPMLRGELEAGNLVLIYPEQEMWFNYRKPRPCKRGAYLYAARLGVPVLPCFVQLHDTGKSAQPNFVEVAYTVHVMEPIFPDPALSARENSIEMCAADYACKVAAYEAVYGKKLSYRFEVGDIAGWVPSEQQRAEVERLWASFNEELCVA